MILSQEEPSDEELVRDSLNGRDEAFSQLVSRHKHRIFGMAFRFARHAHDLEDLCQEIFVRAYRKLSQFRANAPFEHWLSRLAIRVCYDFLRRHRRHRELLSLDDRDQPCEELFYACDETSREAREILARAMSCLTPDERLILTLLELEEKTVKQIAESIGWSESNVKVRAFRARQALKKILETLNELP